MDLCCLCANTGRFGTLNCPCIKAQRPCRSCAPGEKGCCENSVATHNCLLTYENAKRTNKNRFCLRFKNNPLPILPFYENPANKQVTGGFRSKRSKTTHANPPTDDPVNGEVTPWRPTGDTTFNGRLYADAALIEAHGLPSREENH